MLGGGDILRSGCRHRGCWHRRKGTGMHRCKRPEGDLVVPGQHTPVEGQYRFPDTVRSLREHRTEGRPVVRDVQAVRQVCGAAGDHHIDVLLTIDGDAGDRRVCRQPRLHLFPLLSSIAAVYHPVDVGAVPGAVDRPQVRCSSGTEGHGCGRKQILVSRAYRDRAPDAAAVMRIEKGPTMIRALDCQEMVGVGWIDEHIVDVRQLGTGVARM